LHGAPLRLRCEDELGFENIKWIRSIKFVADFGRLFAATNGLDGTVISICDDWHRHEEWLKFLDVIDQVTPKASPFHLIADNDAAHKHPRVLKWLARHRFHVYFTASSSSRRNMV